MDTAEKYSGSAQAKCAGGLASNAGQQAEGAALGDTDRAVHMEAGQAYQQVNINGQSKDAESPQKILVALTSHATEVLRCLFFHGPTWDGNVPSKTGRNELVDMKLAERGQGWQWLTRAGIDACFANGIHNEKDRRESRERQRRYRLEEAVKQLAGAL